ncbi:MarR family winged helix-turn-helix transcriptional regulator [Sediminivirga luteola]|uniref:MarR family winged helix-turn-helix transcriptional regulator n=1 Tax=Sediminivirga luteola TaxID=1774748 RepID=UPI001F5A23BA|nr:MarR family transcriptional regulator [Sediminivirga luteola]
MTETRTVELSSAWTQAAAFTAAVDAKLGKWLTDTYGIGLSEYRAMNHLRLAPDKELRVNELAHKTGLNQSSMTRLLSRLEAKSLTYRDTCPDDGRGVYAVISDEGEALVARMREDYDAKLRSLVIESATHFPELDVRQTADALRAVAELLKN